MKKALQRLQEEICTFEEFDHVSQENIDHFIKGTTLVLAAGGRGQRIESLTQGTINKNALSVESGETLIERTIKMYAAAGITSVVILVYAQAESIIELLGDGSRYGVSITYSHDPEKPVGRGGAILNALLNNSISEDKNIIVHNPDDQIVHYPCFVHDIIAAHIHGTQQGNIATVIVTHSTPYTYTGMKIVNGQVTEVEMFPHIPVPAHIGVTIFSPKVFTYFKTLFSLERKCDFEQLLFPKLSIEQKLYSFGIPHENWIPVNDAKGLERINNALNSKK